MLAPVPLSLFKHVLVVLEEMSEEVLVPARGAHRFAPGLHAAFESGPLCGPIEIVEFPTRRPSREGL